MSEEPKDMKSIIDEVLGLNNDARKRIASLFPIFSDMELIYNKNFHTGRQGSQ